MQNLGDFFDNGELDSLVQDVQDMPTFTTPVLTNSSPKQPTQALPTFSEILAAYPSPDPLKPIEPYPILQRSFEWPQPGTPTLMPFETQADYTRQPFPTLPLSQPGFQFHDFPARPPVYIDSSFLLWGSKGPLKDPKEPSIDGSQSSDPADLALSSESEEDSPTRRKVRKVRKGDRGGQKKVNKRLARIQRKHGDRDQEKPWIVTNKTKGLNRRAAKIASYKAEDHYTALYRTPATWQAFKYTVDGELERGKLYSVAQIERFLYQHPLHNSANRSDRKNSGLIIWIQKNPADSARRYPTSLSSRCRFADCFALNNTINQGQYRVAFDEQSHKECNHDPQHNAGYVHLYCLEKLLDFSMLCACLNVRVENRVLPSEPQRKNPMLLSSKAEQATADEFIQYCTQFGPPLDYPSHQLPNRPHEGTLTHKLALAKLENEPPARKKLRAARGQDKKGTALPNHLGNLEIESVERAKTRMAENQVWSTGEPRKRKRSETDEAADDGVGAEAMAPRRRSKRTRTA